MTQIADFRVITGRRAQLGKLAERITEWRTERYLEAGFYDRASVEWMRRAGLPIETNRPDDYEIAAIATPGQILATISLRRVAGGDGHVLADSRRPWFGLENVHGPKFLSDSGAIPMEQCWEAGRFLRDRSSDSSRAVVAVTTAAARLAAGMAARGEASLVVGEVEPSVALRHLRALGVPVRIGPELDSPQVTGLLANRYAGRKVVPFALRLADISEQNRWRWSALAEREHLLDEDAHAAA